MRKQTVIELRDRDGVMPYSAETLRLAVKGTREYLRHLTASYPPGTRVIDALGAELSLQSAARAFEPLDWLMEEAVMTDREEGGAP